MIIKLIFGSVCLVCAVGGIRNSKRYDENTLIQSDYADITVDLADAHPGTVKTAFENLTDIQYTITLANVNQDVGFLVVQTHNLYENLTLSYSDPLSITGHTTGTNIGLVLTPKPSKVVQNLFLLRQNGSRSLLQLTVLLVVTLYSKYDPVPGGCNLSFETEIAPYQKVIEAEHVLTILSQPPSIFGESCNASSVATEMYYLYLTEYQNGEEEYFEGVQKMLSPEDVKRHGTKVPFNHFRQAYNRYTGTGRVFAVVATSKNNTSSAYVPAVSYGCRVQDWVDDCLEIDGLHWKIITAMMLLCGLFICLAGHRFFRTSLFIVAYKFGVFIMLVVVTVDNDFSEEGKEIYALIMGLFFGCVWNFIWWKYGVPVVSVQLTFILTGFLLASILFFSPLGSTYLFTFDLTYWSLFSMVLILLQVPVLCLKPLSHIVVLSLLGSYAFIVAMSYYMGGILPYVMINTYRRMAVKNFGMAVIDPPFQLMDISLTILWIVVFGAGIFVQRKHSLGKPPFPPHRSGVEVATLGERTPLLSA